MRYDAIFFDLDGTVVDSVRDIADAVNHTMRHFGLPEHDAEALKPLLGWGVGRLMRALLPDASEARIQEILAHYQPYYAEHAGDTTCPFDGILPMLAELKAKGLKLAILSNKPDAALQPIAQKYFAGIVPLAVGERYGVRRKPAPDMLRSAADALGVALSRCLYIGDTEIDIETARNAGIDCVCVTWGFRSREALAAAGADEIVDSTEALKALCLRESQNIEK